MDEVDWVQELVDEERRSLIRRHLRATGGIGEAAANCIDCGEPIPLARRQALPHVRLCVSCQSEREKTR